MQAQSGPAAIRICWALRATQPQTGTRQFNHHATMGQLVASHVPMLEGHFQQCTTQAMATTLTYKNINNNNNNNNTQKHLQANIC